MKKFIGFFAAALLLMSCDKGGTHSEGTGFLYDDGVEHGMIVLGDRLDNPYTTENAQKAFSAVYPTKSRDIVQTTDLYVRFLPENQEEFDLLEEMGVQMLDHPLDFEIITEGDYYHDPSVGEDNTVAFGDSSPARVGAYKMQGFRKETKRLCLFPFLPG